MRLSSLARLAGLLVLASCIAPVDTDQAVGPLSLSVVSGNEQRGPPGTELPNPIVAMVEDSRGHPVKGQIINFVVVSGGGSVFAGAAITGADGIAQERWTLGPSGPQQVEARAVDNGTGAKLTFATFTATLTDVAPPVVTGVATSPANPIAGSPFDLTAVVNDAATGGSNIAGATYTVDGSPPVAMVAQDGAFNQPTEAVLAHVPPFATDGSHNFCVTGSDAAGNVSSPSCITVVVALDAIYVSPAGDDAANGTRAAPLKTIGAALALAASSGKNRVNVAEGIYPENVQLRSGISLYGGYDPTTWTRTPATFITTIGPPPGPSTSGVAVQGDNVTGVTIDGFTIKSGDALVARQSVYGILFTNSVATISGNQIIAGNGGAGADCFAGLAGQNGIAGSDGQAGSANGPEGAGGFETRLLCFGTALIGGAGGQGGPPGVNGQDGAPGNSPNGGNGGAGGSFGIVGVASNLTITGNTIETGNGGAGGAAGDGAAGGAGAAGGLGATTDAPQVGAGGNGGAGGSGGAGGPGGGGGGGPSIGIVSQGGSLAQSGNVFALGIGGAGGAAAAGGNAGSTGLQAQVH